MGVTIQELSKGDGATFPKPGQIVSIHYTGMFENGTKFDSSRDRGKPFKFQLGKDQVLKGWEEGLTKMSLGQRVRLICPPEVAYGKRGYPGVSAEICVKEWKCCKHCFREGSIDESKWYKPFTICLKKHIPANATLIFDMELLKLE